MAKRVKHVNEFAKGLDIRKVMPATHFEAVMVTEENALDAALWANNGRKGRYLDQLQETRTFSVPPDKLTANIGDWVMRVGKRANPMEPMVFEQFYNELPEDDSAEDVPYDPFMITKVVPLKPYEAVRVTRDAALGVARWACYDGDSDELFQQIIDEENRIPTPGYSLDSYAKIGDWVINDGIYTYAVNHREFKRMFKDVTED
jgi:hypothetical protein